MLCSNIAIADPTALEERVAEANLVFGLNSYRELCGLHFGGVTMTSSQLLLKCATRGAKHAMQVVTQIKEALRLDEELRAKGEAASFTECVRLNRITSLAQDRLAIRLKRFKMGTRSGTNPDALDSDEDEEEARPIAVKEEPTAEMDEDEHNELVTFNKTSAALVPQKPMWVPESDFENSDESDEEDDEDLEAAVVKPEPKIAPKKSKKEAKRVKLGKNGKKVKTQQQHDDDDDSEEEETVVMASTD